VRQVLTFARGAEGDRVLIQPAHLIKEIERIARETFPKSITVRTDHPDNLWTIEGEPTQIHQVLLNLSVNARDAMPNGGTLSISAENLHLDDHFAAMTPGATAGPHIVLNVSDTGAGIPPGIIDKIFDPFFTTKEVGTGTGLGLSTVIGIVKSHGGFVNVYSEPGATTFKVFLPASNRGQSEQQPSGSSIPAGQGETILVVDDEPNVRLAAEALLIGAGYKVLVAEDGTEAVAAFMQHRDAIKVLLTDVMMPFMDGPTLVRTLRRLNPELKVIVSTGRADNAHAADLEALRVQACVAKPYTKEKLLATLDELLKAERQGAAQVQ
jgi:CheY-like chemotaxis protein